MLFLSRPLGCFRIEGLIDDLIWLRSQVLLSLVILRVLWAGAQLAIPLLALPFLV